MRHLDDQLTRWAREHPWRWAALGGFALTLISAGLRWALLHRSVEDSLELGGTMGGTWFVLWGLLGWLRLRGLDRDRRVPPDERRAPEL